MKAIAIRLLIAVSILGVVLLGFWATRPGRLLGPDTSTFGHDKVRIGMTEQEVEDAMGLPDGCYERAVLNEHEKQKLPQHQEMITQKIWMNHWYIVVVEFDRGKACGMTAMGRGHPVDEPDPRKRRWWEKLFD